MGPRVVSFNCVQVESDAVGPVPTLEGIILSRHGTEVKHFLAAVYYPEARPWVSIRRGKGPASLPTSFDEHPGDRWARMTVHSA